MSNEPKSRPMREAISAFFGSITGAIHVVNHAVKVTDDIVGIVEKGVLFTDTMISNEIKSLENDSPDA